MLCGGVCEGHVGVCIAECGCVCGYLSVGMSMSVGMCMSVGMSMGVCGYVLVCI